MSRQISPETCRASLQVQPALQVLSPNARFLHVTRISPYTVSCLSFPYSKPPLNSVSDARHPFFKSVMGPLQEKQKIICVSSLEPHTHPYIRGGGGGGVFLKTAGRSHPAKSSTTCRLLTGGFAQPCPAANTPQIPHPLQSSSQKND